MIVLLKKKKSKNLLFSSTSTFPDSDFSSMFFVILFMLDI